MRKRVPEIKESVEELKRGMQGEKGGRKRQRWQMLYLLASGQAREKQEVAQLLGVDRNTVGRWLTQYEEEGIAGLLEIYVPAGVVPAVRGADLGRLQEALANPAGFESYGAVRQWLSETLGIEMEYQAVYKLVHDKLGARLKVARPSHPQKTSKP